MKGFRLGLLALFLGACAFLAPHQILAQGGVAPSQQLGIGIATSGASIIYAITPGLQIGANAALVAATGEGSSTTFVLGPYVRILFEGTVNPFIQAGLNITKSGTASAQTSLGAGFGLAYPITRNVVVHAEIPVVNIPFESGSSVSFGIFNYGAAGIEWFFSR